MAAHNPWLDILSQHMRPPSFVRIILKFLPHPDCARSILHSSLFGNITVVYNLTVVQSLQLLSRNIKRRHCRVNDS